MEEEGSFKVRRKYEDSIYQEPTIIEQGPKSRFIEGRKNMFEGISENNKEPVSSDQRFITFLNLLYLFIRLNHMFEAVNF